MVCKSQPTFFQFICFAHYKLNSLLAYLFCTLQIHSFSVYPFCTLQTAFTFSLSVLHITNSFIFSLSVLHITTAFIFSLSVLHITNCIHFLSSFYARKLGPEGSTRGCHKDKWVMINQMEKFHLFHITRYNTWKGLDIFVWENYL